MRGYPCLVDGSMWNPSNPYTPGECFGCREPGAGHPHIKKRTLGETENEEDPRMCQVQKETRERRKKVGWLETNVKLDGEKFPRPRSMRDYRTVKISGGSVGHKL